MNKDEAIRLAAAINSLRPDWSTNGLMTVLGDDRNRNRPVLDVALAFVALALDPKSRKPTRIYEHGPWWELLAPRVGSSVAYKVIADTDCAICSQPEPMHPLSPTDDHRWEPQHARAESHKPTPEQRAVLDAAAAEAKRAATAEREEKAAREVRDMDAVLAAHQPDAIQAIREELDMPEPEATEEASA